MLEYEFERVDCTGSGGYSFLGGVGLATVGHQEIIRKWAADGWRLAGWIPAHPTGRRLYRNDRPRF